MVVIPEQAGQQKRVFLRIPLRVTAALYLNGKFHSNVKLTDLCTNGLSFSIPQSEKIAGNCEIGFKLKRFSRLIKVKLEIKNSIPSPEGARIGCTFLGISDRDKEYIDQYLYGCINISFPVEAVNSAAFFCAIDASWRILLYSMSLYYSSTEFGKSFPSLVPADSYVVILLAYASFAFFAFIFSSPFVVNKSKINLFASLFFLACIFIFILLQGIGYWSAGLLYTGNFLINVFFGVRLLLVFCVGFAIVAGTLFSSKVNLTLDITKQHLSAISRFRFMRSVDQQK